MIVSKIFIDTAPLIYLLQNHTEFYPKVAGFLFQAVENNVEFETSVLTVSEFCVKPEQTGRYDLIKDFDIFLKELDCRVVDVTLEIAKTASKLRAKYLFLKAVDSLQIATAIENQCDRFLTNDKKLKGIQEIEIIVIAEL
ncbi:type II toxin-antitoxin system VapC family toxin [Larkinella terrae]|uniref:PIN domain-containing protein n=1 Tax=Larkinella terrae TaxID=2025311 RepID=A0A7K0EV42_9BACT|nr:PIN domain-containing protein [Larkinella terrae]MRS65680.1 PIN domain-containing protein [Larkinella terrae]